MKGLLDASPLMNCSPKPDRVASRVGVECGTVDQQKKAPRRCCVRDPWPKRRLSPMSRFHITGGVPPAQGVNE